MLTAHRLALCAILLLVAGCQGQTQKQQAEAQGNVRQEETAKQSSGTESRTEGSVETQYLTTNQASPRMLATSAAAAIGLILLFIMIDAPAVAPWIKYGIMGIGLASVAVAGLSLFLL